MDRKIIFPGSIPLETDLLHTNKNAMLAIGRLAESIIGNATQFSGLAVSPTPVPSLAVVVSPGTIYARTSADASSYSSLPADPTQVLKQGALATAVTLAVAAPTTSGYAVDYLIQVALTEVDVDGTVLPYYNASNPSQAFAGPGNSGAAQPTMRKCVAVMTAIAGAPAPAGSQTAPAPTAGAVPVAIVTVNFGDTSILSGAISVAPGAPVIQRVAGFAPLESPNFSGTPKVPTVPGGDASTRAANTQFVHDAVAGLASTTQVAEAVSGGVAGLATTGYVDAAVAAGYDGSHAVNGYQKMPGGLIMQWGLYSGNDDFSTVLFPIEFPTACFNVQATGSNPSDSSTQNVKAFNFTTTGFTLRNLGSERPSHWFAIGC